MATRFIGSAQLLTLQGAKVNMDWLEQQDYAIPCNEAQRLKKHTTSQT
jgi:hypothetical protein